jgi:poly(ADP-ribose) glycohydrolase ARH3
MRVAPVGLFFHTDPNKVAEEAERSALPTHLHPLGIEGAQLLALAVAHCVRCESWERTAFYDELRDRCRSDEFRLKIDLAGTTRSPQELSALGNGIKAHESVATAIACFASSPDNYLTAIGRAILLGGDTDTIAAMTGAIAGAYLGVRAIPTGLLDRLENWDKGKGRTYIDALARKLLQRRESDDRRNLVP